MNINSISNDTGKVTLTLNIEELKNLANIMFATDDKHKDQKYHKLYSDIILARDLCQYGHLDESSLSFIVQHRNESNEGIYGLLSKNETDVLNEYLESNDIATACGNTDFCKIYNKIVGDNVSEKIKELMNKSRE